MVSTVPGLKVVFPATARDAKGLMTAALRGNDPVLYFESQRLYDLPELVHADGVPADDYEVRIGEPKHLVRTGTCNLHGRRRALPCARCRDGAVGEVRPRGRGHRRSLARAVRVRPAARIRGEDRPPPVRVRRESARQLAQHRRLDGVREAFDDLDAPVTVLGARNWISPPAELEWEYFVTPDDIVDAVHERIIPLSGHTLQPGRGAGIVPSDSALGI